VRLSRETEDYTSADDSEVNGNALIRYRQLRSALLGLASGSPIHSHEKFFPAQGLIVFPTLSLAKARKDLSFEGTFHGEISMEPGERKLIDLGFLL